MKFSTGPSLFKKRKRKGGNSIREREEVEENEDGEDDKVNTIKFDKDTKKVRIQTYVCGCCAISTLFKTLKD